MDVLNPNTLKRLFDHGRRDYPRECCGMVFTDGTVHEADNIQQTLHEQCPETYRRNAATGFAFSITDNRMLGDSFETDNPVQVIYHSHPDVGAYFSQQDRDKALFCGEPIFPVAHLVLDIRAGTPVGAKLFRFVEGDFQCTETFNEEGLRIHKSNTPLLT